MTNANEAKLMANEFHAKKESELMAKIEKFLDNECESAITTAAMNGKYECFVEVPKGLADDTAKINALLLANGYMAQTRFGTVPAVLIKWDRAK
jgi:hypothetical protein